MHETTMGDDERRRARDLADRGHGYWKQGNHSAAIEWFTRALSADPGDPWTLMRRGAARAAINDIAGAAEDLNRAKAMVPRDDWRSRRHWAAAQLGEGIRSSLRDAALPPEVGAAGVEAMLADMDASIAAFTEAIQEDPSSAWAYAHRGAVATLAHWLGARTGVDPERVRRYAGSAWDDLDAALRLDGAYKWALVFRGLLLTIRGSNEPDDAERRALFARAAGSIEAAGRADERFPVLRALTEFALYNRDFDDVIEIGWRQLSKDPADTGTRYCVAQALLHVSSRRDADDPAIAAARCSTAGAVAGQARRAMLARRTQTCAMLGGLAMLEGDYEVAAAMLDDVLEYPDMDTLVFMRRDPAWDLARDPAAGARDPRLVAVSAAYAKLFPQTPRRSSDAAAE
ncbi:tetratricopeptide repeat protein [Sorangium sp. So ce1024]|uniref:tetratricopeptide repeat protein n=1 Tax=unclassified Sorangium TaxID=2621164 RepID=UPI003F04F398